MKTEITTNKGTRTLSLEVGIPNWSGTLFKEYQEKKMASLPADAIIVSRRGTCGIKASMYPKPRRNFSTHGIRISSARGTRISTL
ncbi:MAG TPA: hypothetical protein VFG25_00515 [Nitrosopumilaceae archaeon]|nr:hypothetical protein [Nitrosopumilaceae archaeon]